MQKTNDILFNLDLPTSAQNVMRLLCNQQQIEIWTGEDAVFDTQVGGQISFFAGWILGRLEKMNEQGIEFSWRAQDWDEETENAKAVMLCSDFEGYASLKILLSNLPSELVAQQQQVLWQDDLLTPFEDYVMIQYPDNED